MAYNYYRNALPGWGTSQFQFGAPPPPTFQPQPGWGGMDYYRAHAVSPDPSLYDHAWGRVRNYQPGMHGLGVGLNEARHWHRRAYGGLGELTTMRPTEIGHAAAYEAYRTWIHNSSIYEPLSGDLERQREGLIGLAIAEAARLLQYTQSPYDTYARTEASDAAAATASIIFYQSREDGQDEYRSRPRSRAGSFAGGSGYASSIGGDPYALDDPLLSSRRYRSRSRHRSLSRGRGSPTIINLPPQMPSGGMPYPGQAGSAYGMPPPVGGYPPMGGGYPGSAGSYGSFGSPYSPSFPPENAAMQPGVGGFAGGAPGYGPNYAGSAFGGSAYGAGMPMMNPSASMGYGQPPYMMQQPMMGMAPTAGPTTVILQSSRRKHRHRHRRSSDGYASD
ncbi:hypothetical protein EYR40_006768 [Pleurotus pulmonarius]|nr:hypothetical protein EYR36_011387 [Pleurotus pulmonarius]KAF4599669.1 hypothetical protein EYR40_006768 [Pleurotus pulmonarius]